MGFIPNEILLQMMKMAGVPVESIESIVCMGPDGENEVVYMAEGIEDKLITETEQFLKAQNASE